MSQETSDRVLGRLMRLATISDASRHFKPGSLHYREYTVEMEMEAAALNRRVTYHASKPNGEKCHIFVDGWHPLYSREMDEWGCWVMKRRPNTSD